MGERTIKTGIQSVGIGVDILAGMVGIPLTIAGVVLTSIAGPIGTPVVVAGLGIEIGVPIIVDKSQKVLYNSLGIK